MEIICELVPGLGETLVASRRALVTALVRAMRKAVSWTDTREIRVRLARQRAGFALSDNVLLTVTGEQPTQSVHVELAMPTVGEQSEERVADGVRLLVIAPSPEAARVMVGVARRAGAAAHAVADPEQARSALREASAGGRRYDIVVIDDAHPATSAFIDALRDDASLGGPPSVVAALGDEASVAEVWRARGATAVMDKPVLPAQLGATIAGVLMRGDAPGATRLPSGRLRVLVGEDDPIVARITARTLEQMGHEVVVEPSGRAIVKRLAAESFDVLLIDVGLEDLNGLAVARMVKKQRASGGEAPSMVLAVTAGRLDPKVAAAAGVDAVLEKPLDPQKLREHIPSTERRVRDSSTRLVAHAAEKAPVLDLAELLSRAGGDEALVRELLTDFLTHSARWSATLREACQSGAFAEAGRLAHRLRGALAGLGARSASIAAEVVERHVAASGGVIGSEERANLAVAVPDLERRLEDVRAAARAHLHASSAARR